MSNNDNVSSFLDFNADALLQDFFYANELERKAIRFVYKMMSNDDDLPEDNKARRYKELIRHVKDHVEFRFCLFKKNYENFFLNDPASDYDSMAIIVICNEYIENINEPIRIKRTEPARWHDNDNELKTNEDNAYRDDGFDDDLVDHVLGLSQDADDLAKYGGKYSGGISRETQFLAHIIIMEELYELREQFDEQTYNNAEYFIQKEAPRFRKVLDLDTDIGKEIEVLVADMELQFLTKMAAHIPAPQNPLHLVPPEGPQ